MKTLNKKQKKIKAILLFSGGLDSIIALRLLKEQNIDVIPVFFILPFSKPKIPKIKNLKIIDCTKGKNFKDYLKLIKKPKHGYGVELNPCKDCKIFMLKKAKTLAKELNADFIATGEVLSQRPNSQKKYQLLLIEKEAGLENNILRPLSAKLLPETKIEKKKIIQRENLLNIEGKQRKTQMQIAKKHKIKYPEPAGGCLLCEKHYAPKLKDLFENQKSIKSEDIQLLKIGRHFRSQETNKKIILGKNEIQNNQLENLSKTIKCNLIKQTKNTPSAIFYSKKDKKLAKDLIKAYSTNQELRLFFEKIRIK